MGVKFVSVLLYVLETIFIAQCALVLMDKGNNSAGNLNSGVLNVSSVENFLFDIRKQLMDIQDPNQKSNEDKTEEKKEDKKEDSKGKDVESIVFAIKIGDSVEKVKQTNPIIQTVTQLLGKMAGNYAPKFTTTTEKSEFKPQIVDMKNGKSSMYYEIELQGIFDNVKNLMQHYITPVHSDSD